MNKNAIRFSVISAIVFGALFSFVVYAQSGEKNIRAASIRQYWYDSISVIIHVNRDSTIDVAETQTFHYDGAYHQASRQIPIDTIGSITDVVVVDGKTDTPLVYSRRTLDKTDPSSWGKYTYSRAGGNMNIEWYYNLSDTAYPWIIKYKVHGALEFQKEWDRLYWDIFSGYQVPIQMAEAAVFLPEGAEKSGFFSYRTAREPHEYTYAPGTQEFFVRDTNFGIKEAFTIDLAWPPGMVDRTAFWRDFIFLNYGYIGAALIAILALLFVFLYWLFKEKLPKGRGVIIPQYEPPDHLRPAMAEVITKERVTPTGWAATVVDLAVRGYVKIEEIPQARWIVTTKKIAVFSVSLLMFGLILYFAKAVFGDIKGFGAQFEWLLDIFIVLFLAFQVYTWIFSSRKRFLSPADFIVIDTRKPLNDIEPYEKGFLEIIFDGEDRFSTKDIKKEQARARALHKKMKELEKNLYKETATDTNAYEIPIFEERKKVWIWTGVILVSFVVFWIAGFSGWTISQGVIIGWALVAGIVWVFAFVRYEARLSREGRILKEEWLGFKLYLETAEKNRLANLTPDLFEKYLPYAMIFGVEKKWARAFEGISLAPPSWYSGGSGIASFSTSSGSSGFSASLFSASFSSSFTSAFSSSGAGGSGAGGGGVGGGGGGGGGGAS